ncbi:hypothetical protein [Pseudomonas oryziphila]|uniref:Transposase n=1 Tax=Pseudomonas oryziphila TaxID=2894079 RepID=A0ABN5TKE9_9PSED|nr:hypothetical protein [Pseudomonas oryziphila]AZL74561.1 hypothetical protein EI693_16375 [Pseudomonas oryziphila]
MPAEKQPAWPDHFRYADEISPDGVTIVCQRFVVLRESEHCYWIAPYRFVGLARVCVAEGRKSPLIKRVLKESHGRRFAYPDKAKALHSYKVRKRRQLGHAQLAMERAKTALEDLKGVDVIADERLCAGGDFIKELNWEDY